MKKFSTHDFTTPVLLFYDCAWKTAVEFMLTSPGTTARCVDKEGTSYNLGYNFARRDGWICNCTQEGLKTRLVCRSPRTSTSYNPGIIFQPTYIERQRAIARGRQIK